MCDKEGFKVSKDDPKKCVEGTTKPLSLPFVPFSIKVCELENDSLHKLSGKAD